MSLSITCFQKKYSNFIFGLLLLFCPLFLQAQVLEKSYPKNDIGGVHLEHFVMSEEGLGFIAGSCETLLRTTDEGVNWKKMVFPNIPHIHFLTLSKDTNEPTLVAASELSIQISNNLGQNWTAIDNSLFDNPETFTSINAIDNGEFLIACQSGNFYRLTDGARTIEKMSNIGWEGTWRINQLDDQHIWAYSFNTALLFKSEDGGYKWEELPIDFLAGSYFLALDFLDSDIGFLRAINGIYKTKDGGLNWTLYATTSPYFVDNNPFLYAKSENELFHFEAFSLKKYEGPDNEVITLNHFNQRRTFYKEKCFISPQNHFWILGENNTLMQSKDGGLNWENRGPSPDYLPISIHFPSTNTITAITSPFSILKSTDNGQNWQHQIDPANPNLEINYSLQLDQDFYLLYGPGGLYHLKNETLSKIPNRFSFSTNIHKSPSGSLYTIAFINGSTLIRSLDNGRSWEELHQFNFLVSGLSIPAEGILYAYGFGGNMDKSTDGGTSWKGILFNEPLRINAFHFITPDYGILSNRNQQIITTNGGRTFKVYSTNNWLQKILMESKTKGWAYGSYQPQSELLQTRDGGKNWSAAIAPICGQLKTFYQNPHTKDIWLLGQWGGMYRVNNPNAVTNNTPNQLSLSPNPVLDHLLIETPLTDRAIQQFRLYNSNGVLVGTFPAYRTVKNRINMIAFPAGVYVIQGVGPGVAVSEKVIKL